MNSSILFLAETVLRAVIDAADLTAARAAAQDGLDRLVQETPGNIVLTDEAKEITGKSRSQIRKLAAKHGLGRKLGGRWIFFRNRLHAYLAGGA